MCAADFIVTLESASGGETSREKAGCRGVSGGVRGFPLVLAYLLWGIPCRMLAGRPSGDSQAWERGRGRISRMAVWKHNYLQLVRAPVKGQVGRTVTNLRVGTGWETRQTWTEARYHVPRQVPSLHVFLWKRFCWGKLIAHFILKRSCSLSFF